MFLEFLHHHSIHHQRNYLSALIFRYIKPWSLLVPSSTWKECHQRAQDVTSCWETHTPKHVNNHPLLIQGFSHHINTPPKLVIYIFKFSNKIKNKFKQIKYLKQLKQLAPLNWNVILALTLDTFVFPFPYPLPNDTVPKI